VIYIIVDFLFVKEIGGASGAQAPLPPETPWKQEGRRRKKRKKREEKEESGRRKKKGNERSCVHH
jgi:hypothetical protein